MGRRPVNYFEPLTPFYAYSDPLYLDLGRKVAQDPLIAGMNIERRRHQEKTRRSGTERDSGEIAMVLKLAAVQMPLDAEPIIQGLQGQMEVFGGFELDDGEASVPIGRDQIEDAAITGREGRHLPIDRLRKQSGVDDLDILAHLGFQQGLRVEAAIEFAGMRTGGIGAGLQMRVQVAMIGRIGLIFGTVLVIEERAVLHCAAIEKGQAQAGGLL
jgi:hypothetical protein